MEDRSPFDRRSAMRMPLGHCDVEKIIQKSPIIKIFSKKISLSFLAFFLALFLLA